MAAAGECPLCGSPLPDGVDLHGVDRNYGVEGEFAVRICRSCGGGVTAPAINAAELGGLYPTTYQAYQPGGSGVLGRVSALIRSWQGFRALRTDPISALRELEPGRAVDIGCGRGDLGATLIGRGWQVTGVEPSREACDVARARGIDARCGGVADAGLEPSSYDAAIFRHSLEHLTDPVGDLRTAGQALRPGGLMLISVPNFGGWQARRFGSRWYHLDLPRHRFHFDAPALEAAIRAAGLEITSLSTSTSTVGLPASVQYALFGHCLFPNGLRLRVASGLCVLAFPLSRLLDLIGGGDELHAVARRS